MSDSTIVLAQLEVEECTAELYVNGVPVSRITPPRLPLENTAVEHLLVPGKNRIEVLVEPGLSPSRARLDVRPIPHRPMRAIGRLIRFPDKVFASVENGILLAETMFEYAPGPPRTFPIESAAQVDLGEAHGRWAWQDAPPLSFGPALVDEAHALLQRLAAILRAKRWEDFWKITELQLKDVQRAFPAITEGEQRRHLAELRTQYEKVADPVVSPNRAMHDFRLVAGDRLMELIDRDWSTSLKMKSPGDGSPVPYRIFVARIGGELKIVR